jgi:hypothetical protein
MNNRIRFSVLLSAATLILSMPAQATMEARYLDATPGIDAYFDTATGLTWLQNVHHADGTLDMSSPSSLTWAAGSAWAAGLGTGWRMPSTLDATGWESNSEMLTLATEGNLTGAYFQGLVIDPAMRPVYWSETNVSYYGATIHFNFSPTPPANSYSSDSILAYTNTYALAVHTGDIGGVTEPPPVPEPSTTLLLGAGVAGLAFWRRIRRSSLSD